ncbi:MAG: hypothetical protein ABJC63_12335 [Gemmatimonadales bacterium]
MIAGAVSAPWLDAPLRRFVQDSRVQRAIVLHPDGKVLGQFGFASSVEVMTACALAAAINASGRELGRQLGGSPFLGLHQSGRKQVVIMGSCATGGKECLLLAAVDRDSTQREFEVDPSGRDLESDLNSSVDALFGPLN